MIYRYLCNSCSEYFEANNTYEKRNTARCSNCTSSNVTKLITGASEIRTCGYLKDVHGEPIWFPKDGNPYFDKALRRTFVSAKEKKEYMDKKKICMTGDREIVRWPIEAGDMRDKSYRKSIRMED